MTTMLTLFAGFGLGIALGVLYFAGLWLTVRRVVVCANPERWLRLSRMVRMLSALALMVTVIRFDPIMFLAMMPGFLAGRFLVSRRIVWPQSNYPAAPQLLCQRPAHVQPSTHRRPLSRICGAAGQLRSRVTALFSAGAGLSSHKRGC